jgi:formylglycine-generating enzyme required for sulfatase activity
MSGNVWEWCFDLSGSNRVLRGGDWVAGGDYVQLGIVVDISPTYKENQTGLRLGRTE